MGSRNVVAGRDHDAGRQLLFAIGALRLVMIGLLGFVVAVVAVGLTAPRHSAGQIRFAWNPVAAQQAFNSYAEQSR